MNVDTLQAGSRKGIPMLFSDRSKHWQDCALRCIWGCCPFYRLYPYQQPVHIQAADRHGAIDGRHGFFYNRIPKCANSTVVEALATFSGKVRSDDNTVALKRAFGKPHQLSHRQVVRLRDHWLKFTFVRNPYARVLSAYLDKIIRLRYDLRPRYRALRAATRATDAPPSFDRFLDYLAAGGLYANVHWAPQTALLLIPLVSFDFVGKVENLDQDLLQVLQRLFPDQAHRTAVKFGRAGPPPTGAQDKVFSWCTRQQRDRIAALYENDITALGYYFL